MRSHLPHARPLVLGLIGLLVASAVLTPAALAGNTVTTTVVGGVRSASIADAVLGVAAYAHTAQTQAGTLTLTADDASGTNLGWNVTVQASAFVYSGLYVGSDIPAADFALTSAATPVKVVGQGVSSSNGPKVPATSPVGTLDVARKAVQADPGFGKGTYTQALGVALTVPADSVAGTYTGTLTVTITAGP